MKALTLTQPWATLVAIGAKKIETRSWNTNYRGRLAIHAAKGFPGAARSIAFRNEYFKSALTAAGYQSPDDLPVGVVLGGCNLVRVERITDQTLTPPMPEYEFGSYDVGRYMWYLEDFVRYSAPIPAKGALSLWEWSHATPEESRT